MVRDRCVRLGKHSSISTPIPSRENLPHPKSRGEEADKWHFSTTGFQQPVMEETFC